MTALREIKLLRELRGPYIVQLLDVFAHKRKNLQLVRSPHRLRVALRAVVGVVTSRGACGLTCTRRSAVSDCGQSRPAGDLSFTRTSPAGL